MNEVLCLLSQGETVSWQYLGDQVICDDELISAQHCIDQLSAIGLKLQIQAHGFALDAHTSKDWLRVIPKRVIAGSLNRTNPLCVHITHYYWTDSTQTRLMSEPPPPPDEIRCAVSEYQSLGRGRLAKRWLQPVAEGLLLSAAMTFEEPVELQALSLAVGIVLAEKIQSIFDIELQLKWPNDLIRDGAKCGGILCESRAHPDGFQSVVIGIGINGALHESMLQRIGALGGQRKATALSSTHYDRSTLLEGVVDGLVELKSHYRQFAPWVERFNGLDCLRGQPVRWRLQGGTIDGLARGIGDDGALWVETAGGLKAVYAGEIDRSQ
jgi:BirA family biotin operon repressor/biotin-[acetyl-CoA-carboxylase] ligase